MTPHFANRVISNCAISYYTLSISHYNPKYNERKTEKELIFNQFLYSTTNFSLATFLLNSSYISLTYKLLAIKT